MRREDGFTLVEMLIVLLIISVLILITIPNVTRHFKTVDTKACDAYVKMIDSQIEAYRVEKPRVQNVTLDLLKDAEYLRKDDLVNEALQCPDGRKVEIIGNKAYAEELKREEKKDG